MRLPTIGYIGSSGSPCIKIKVGGLLEQEFEVTVDTGFTGFMSMPVMTALPLGLTLFGTTSVQFGDGNTSVRFTALGSAEMAGEKKGGIIILEPSSSGILVGMEFLKTFEKTIFMHRGVLFVMDQSEIDKTLPQESVETFKNLGKDTGQPPAKDAPKPS